MRKALIDNGTIVNVITVPDDFDGDTWGGYTVIDPPTNGASGDTWDGATLTKPVVAGPRVVASDEFRDRFTDAELVAISKAAETDDNVRLYWIKATTAPTVNLDSPVVDAGLDLLVSEELLASGRKAEILA